MAMVQTGYMPLYDPQSVVFGRNALISGQVHQEVIVTDPQGKQWQASTHWCASLTAVEDQRRETQSLPGRQRLSRLVPAAAYVW